MAKLRVFISSTFFDLRQVREDMERTIRELGYEPVRNETGTIPYGKDEAPESAAYREIELCDIIVAIVGGRFGTESRDIPGHSISQNELRRALEQGIQVFIFIEKSVHAEFSTYELNKDSEVRYRFVDDVRVFKFIEELTKLPRNNPIATFETAYDIANYFREQCAGLFQRFLQDQKRGVELRALDEMNAVTKTLKDVVGFLTEERKSRDDAIKSILLANHPVFRRFAYLTKTPYRVFFTTEKELNTWLRVRGWQPIVEAPLDEDSVREWSHSKEGYIKLTKQLFDQEGRLLPFSADQWSNAWLERVVPPDPIPEDDVPF